MRAEYQRCTSDSPALARARTTAAPAQQRDQVRSFSGTAVSRSARNSSGGIAITIDGRDHRDEEADQLPAVRAGEAEDPPDERPVDAFARDCIRIAPEAPHRLVHHPVVKPTGVPGDSPPCSCENAGRDSGAGRHAPVNTAYVAVGRAGRRAHAGGGGDGHRSGRRAVRGPRRRRQDPARLRMPGLRGPSAVDRTAARSGQPELGDHPVRRVRGVAAAGDEPGVREPRRPAALLRRGDPRRLRTAGRCCSSSTTPTTSTTRRRRCCCTSSCTEACSPW